MSSEELGHEHTTLDYPKIFSILDVSHVIPNKVSMARDQLAGERNYLTFLRFSCTLIVLGFTMLLQFRLPYESTLDDTDDEPDRITRPLGYCFVAIGFCLFIYGLVRYYMNQHALIRQVNYIQAGWGSMTVMAILAAFAIGVMILATIHSTLFAQPPSG